MGDLGYSTYRPKGDNHYITQDTALAAALMAVGYPIVDVVKKSEKTAAILFMDDAQLQEDVIAFTNNNLMVDAATFWQCMRTLRSRCKSVTGNF